MRGTGAKTEDLEMVYPEAAAESGTGTLSFEEYLAKYGSLTYRNKGVSMMPLLKQGRDLFTLVPKGDDRCKKYDVVLYKNRAGSYVLHRIIKVRPDGYVIRGDNTYHNEYRKDEDIIGVMSSFVHNGKNGTVDGFWYKVYVCLNQLSYPVRWLYFRCRGIAGAALRKLGLRK